MNKDPKKLPFKISTFFSEISVAKNNKLAPSEYVSREQNDPDGALFSQIIYEIYVDEFDEVPVNKYCKMKDLNGIFIENTFSIHPIYNSIPNHRKYEQELFKNIFN